MTTKGRGDFDDKDRAVTMHYECSACSQPTDPAEKVGDRMLVDGPTSNFGFCPNQKLHIVNPEAEFEDRWKEFRDNNDNWTRVGDTLILDEEKIFDFIKSEKALSEKAGREMVLEEVEKKIPSVLKDDFMSLVQYQYDVNQGIEVAEEAFYTQQEYLAQKFIESLRAY